MRATIAIASFVLFFATVFAQSPSAPIANAPPAEDSPTFVIAGKVRSSPHRIFARIMGPVLRGDRYFLRQAPMRDLVGLAYGVNPGYVQAGPQMAGDGPVRYRRQTCHPRPRGMKPT